MEIYDRNDLSPYYLDTKEGDQEGEWYAQDHIYYSTVGIHNAFGVRELPSATSGPEMGVSVSSEAHWCIITDGNKIAKTVACLPPFPFEAYIFDSFFTPDPTIHQTKVTINKIGEQGNFNLITPVASHTIVASYYSYTPDFTAPETSYPSSGYRIKPLLGAPYGAPMTAEITTNSWVHPYPYPKSTVSPFRDPEVQYGAVAGMLNHDIYDNSHRMLGYSMGKFYLHSASVMPEGTLKVLPNQLIRDSKVNIDDELFNLNIKKI